MITDAHLGASRTVRGPKTGPFGEHVHLHVDWLLQRGYIRVVCHRALSLARDFPIWFDATRASRGDIREELVTGYPAERSRHRPRYRGDSLAVARSLSVRETNAIAPAADAPGIHARIFFRPTACTWTAFVASRQHALQATSGFFVHSCAS